nr:ribokinase [Planctomycetota bacterium]
AKPRIAVLGSMNMDLVVQCPDLPRPGETITASSFTEISGGKGANQAVAAARLGGDVSMIGRVGDDAFGRQLLGNLNREGIDTSLVRATDRCPSGIAIVAVEQCGENSIIVVPGANGRLDKQDVSLAAERIRASDALLLQLETPINTALAAINIAREAGVRVILDPAPAPTFFPPELFAVDVLCPNQSEASAILGWNIQSVCDAKDAAAELNRRGITCAIITLGDRGTVASENERPLWFEPVAIKPIDTTAAGDAFAAAFTIHWVKHELSMEAVRYACAAGAFAASRAGAQPAMPRREDVLDLLESEKE